MDVDIEAVLEKAQEITPSGGPGRVHMWLVSNIDAVHGLRAHSYSWADIAYLFHRAGYAENGFQTQAGTPLAGDTLRKKCARAGYRPDRVKAIARGTGADSASAASRQTADADVTGSSNARDAAPGADTAASANQTAARALDQGRCEPTTQPVSSDPASVPTRAAPSTRAAPAAGAGAVRHAKEDLLQKREERSQSDNGGER